MKSITLIHRGKEIVHHAILNNQIRIGASMDSDLVLAADLVAEGQMVLSRDDAGLWRSSVDGTTDENSRALGNGARIPFGDVVIEFRDWPGAEERILRADRTAPPTTRKGVDIIGESTVMRELKLRLARMAPMREPVLILGETGTGKELAARAIHEQSSSAAGPFVPVNCGALNESMVEDVLFGHEKGSFTGAGQAHRGVFEQADGGTLFLDEIGELPLSQQAALLRVLDGGAVSRIGSEKACRVEFRLVAATNRDLSMMVEEGKFRLDLFHRISTLTVHTPPLRNRKGDIPLLARVFLKEIAKDGPRGGLSKDAMDTLDAYRWPGNIRELRNVLLRAWVLGSGERIETSDLELASDLSASGKKSLKRPLSRESVMEAMDRCDGNVTAAAKVLSIPRTTLRTWLNRMNWNRETSADDYSVINRDTAFSSEPARS